MAFNRRLFFWLIREYLRKFGKSIIIFFIIGIAVFFIVRTFFISYLAKFSFSGNEKIGLIGSVTVDNLPSEILNQVSDGLTKIDKNGNLMPDLANKWDITDSGKTYIFYLKKNIYFSDGSKFTSADIKYTFSNVKKITPNDNTIIFELKEPYAPFLTTVSKPIFKSGFIGTGDYKILKINLNSGFITSIILQDNKNRLHLITYDFYPTEEALKIAFMIGEVNIAEGLNNLNFRGENLANLPNAISFKGSDYDKLITVFYNNSDSNLSDKRLRDALAYSLPNDFMNGERAHSPYPPTSWAYVEDTLHTQDLEHAKLLLKEVISDNKKTLPPLTIYYIPEFRSLAQVLQKSWEQIGVKTILKETPTTPPNFQIFLTSFNVPSDPDQYTLWHSDQENNITGYKNLRIDKLLEDGRRTIDQSERIKIYADFQKYLLDDQPASFLYFPYSYTIERK